MRKSKFFAIISILIVTLIAMIAVGCSHDQLNTQSHNKSDIETFTVSYQASVGGKIVGDTVQTIDHGEDSQSVEAVSDEGYIFVEWSDGNNESTRYEKNVTENLAFTARFEVYTAETFSVVYSATDGGSIDGDVCQTVKSGASGDSVTAVAQHGYEFVEWSDGVKTATRQDTDIQRNKSITAIFQKKNYSVTYLTNGDDGVLVGATEQTVKHGANASAVTAQPKNECYFVEWSDGVKTAIRQDTDIQEDKSITAIFHKYYWLRYVSYDSDGGMISGDEFQYIKHGESGSTVTAIPKEGYEFVRWSDGETEQQRKDDNITKNITYTAYFTRKKFKVEYKQSKGGWISCIQYRGMHTDYGEQSSTVRAVPNKGYVFVEWSDGLTTPERTEYNVKSDMTFTAYFGYGAEYTVNNNSGGKIVGKTSQAVRIGGDFDEVEAIPDDGYAFDGWSDLKNESKRKDINAERCIEHIAYFAPIERTFKLDYGKASGMPLESSVTMYRNNIRLDGYPTPSVSEYTFEGWYADKDYKLKAINSDGRYMLGYYGFSLETDTLYARWKPVDDETRTFKILLVFVNEVEATLYPAKIGGEKEPRDVHHMMTAIDREFCAVSHDLVSKYLTEWLSGLTTVEVDAYYSTQSAGVECIGYWAWKSDSYGFETTDFPELLPLYASYHSILTTFGVDNLDGYLANLGTAGTATVKFADIHLENFYLSSITNHRPLQDYLLEIKTNDLRAEEFIGTFIHEFIHTCELAYSTDDIINFHRAFFANYTHADLSMQIKRSYILGEIEYNGKIGGIPKNFWEGYADILVPMDTVKAWQLRLELKN